jgi:hypothetical protein
MPVIAPGYGARVDVRVIRFPFRAADRPASIADLRTAARSSSARTSAQPAAPAGGPATTPDRAHSPTPRAAGWDRTVSARIGTARGSTVRAGTTQARTTRIGPAQVGLARIGAARIGPIRAGVVPLLAVAALTLAGCGGATPPPAAPPSAATASATPAAQNTPAPTPPATSARASGAAALPTACSLVPGREIAAASGLRFGPPAPAESERRSVCAFAAGAGTTGLSVGVEPAARFDAKADASRRSVGVAGVPVAGLGDQALFFYSAADLPEGVGGVLVRSGAATVDITLQGVGDEARTREGSVAIARVALGNL